MFPQRPIPRWDNNRRDPSKFQLKLKAWCYIQPDEVPTITSKVADFLRKRSSSYPVKWEITTREPTPETPIAPTPDREGLAYVALNLVFTTTDGGSNKLSQESNCRWYFDDLTRNLLCPSFKVSREKIGIDFVTWDLAPSWGWSTAFSRYWLKGWERSPTTEEQTLPAYNIGYALRHLTSLDGVCKRDKSHDSCPKEAALECIKHLLRQAQQELSAVREAASSSLRQRFDPYCKGCSCNEEVKVKMLIQENIQHTVATNQSIKAIIHLLNKNVGFGHSRFFLMRILRKIFSRPKYPIAVTDNTFGSKKQTMDGDASYLRCMSLTMVGHIRLRSAALRHNLCDNVHQAAPGSLEQTQLMSYFGLVASRVGEQSQHDAALDKVSGRFFNTFDNVVKEIEALIQILDNEYAEKGEKMFKKKRKAVPEGTPRCLLEKATLNEKLYKLENDSDSELDVEFNEKC
ncbi:hypothetical protein B0T21DRAFT_283584 [Apiosordaria backusii]|uniref:Uncharacterized protein n=1 Tax=Apiosordaria backusii TaxID=314023 RepID=A0AA40K1M2_9PEZI|nr:hypothetical protein B0T21DRAFT_283584 [Apiosordaria backusii]